MGYGQKLEKKLPELIAKRQKAYFEVEAVPMNKVQEVVEQLKKVA